MKTKKYRKGAIAGAFIFIILLIWPEANDSSKMIIRDINEPIDQIGSHLNRKTSGFRRLLNLKGISQREKHLSIELVKAQSELNRLKNIEEENLKLRKALSFKQSSAYLLIPTTVINRNISGWWNTVRIQSGSKEGIKNNSAVLSPDGLVGKTFQVNNATTEVLLLSDPAFRVAAKIADRKVYGIVRGMGKSIKGQPLARIEFINKDIKIKIGDEVTTSGFHKNNEFFPSDIHIGYVEKIHTDKSGLYQYAEIIPRASAGLLDYLFIAIEEKN